jgi:hypothetical protein
MTSSDAWEQMAGRVLKPARSIDPVNLTTLGAEAKPAEVLAHPDFVPDAVADAIEIGGMPTHEELVMQVFELRQVIRANDEAHLLELASFEHRLHKLEAMPHNQWRPNNAGSDPAA